MSEITGPPQRNKPLTVEVSDEVLTVSIGIETLANAIVAGPAFDQAKITDANMFIADLVIELQAEEEDGSTLLHRAFDEAGQAAADNGSEGIKFPGDRDFD